MTDREKDIKGKLVDVHSKLMGLLQRAPYIRCEDVHRQYAVNWLMNNGVTVQKWIPGTERLPENTDDVIVCHENGWVTKDAWFVRNWWHKNEVNPITHWMPLPEPPKEG